MKEDYKKMFDSLTEQKEELNIDSRVLLIDSLNMFMRSFAIIQHTNKSLTPIGGLTGFLRSLGSSISLVRPTRVILVFDGKGSSTNKRYIYPEYKANRGIRRITNWDHYENQEDESESMTNQLVRLIEYLKCLPVDLVSIDKIEADDVIGRLAKKYGKEVTVVSSDRDYLQLVDDRITVFSPTKKIFYNKRRVLEEYGVHPNNFLIQKMLLGDTGDNVPGVNGLGQKTLLKEFPKLANETPVTLEEILEVCEGGSKKVHGNVLSFKNQLKINQLLMDLNNPNIPDEDVLALENMLLEPYKHFDSQEFVKLYNEDDLGASIKEPRSWLYKNFNELSKYKM
jgi:5'-3' exonuclease